MICGRGEFFENKTGANVRLGVSLARRPGTEGPFKARFESEEHDTQVSVDNDCRALYVLVDVKAGGTAKLSGLQSDEFVQVEIEVVSA